MIKDRFPAADDGVSAAIPARLASSSFGLPILPALSAPPEEKKQTRRSRHGLAGLTTSEGSFHAIVRNRAHRT